MHRRSSGVSVIYRVSYAGLSPVGATQHLARVEGLDPSSCGFGDRSSALNYTRIKGAAVARVARCASYKQVNIQRINVLYFETCHKLTRFCKLRVTEACRDLFLFVFLLLRFFLGFFLSPLACKSVLHIDCGYDSADRNIRHRSPSFLSDINVGNI